MITSTRREPCIGLLGAVVFVLESSNVLYPAGQLYLTTLVIYVIVILDALSWGQGTV